MSLVSINDVLKITTRVEKIHPYKVVGDRDSYSPYNEGWSDCVSLIEHYLEQIPSAEPERKTFHVIDKRTGEEADTWEIALNEKWAKSLCYCDMEGFAILEDGTLILTDECGRFEYIQEEDRFEIIWDEVNDED